MTSGSSPPVRGTRAARLRIAYRLRFIPACAGNTQNRIPQKIDYGFIPACAGNTATAQRRGTAWAVHPRLCGEHMRSRWPASRRAGSSPPVRGTPREAMEAAYRRRFIPACAGNTSQGSPVGQAHTVHPRLCGEHAHLGLYEVNAVGSSPPVRGTPSRRDEFLATMRFIPACAGNTHCPAPFQSCRRFIPACAGNTMRTAISPRLAMVHPRLCGEHSSHKTLKNKDFGDYCMGTNFSQ